MRAYLRTYASFFALVATLALVAAVSIALRPPEPVRRATRSERIP